MTFFQGVKLAAAAVICAALAGCLPATDTVASDVSQSSNRVILVGSFELTPSVGQNLNLRQSVLRPAEEALFGSPEDMLGNRLITGFQPFGTLVRETMFSTPWTGSTHAVPLDELFFIEVDRGAIQLQNGKYLLSDLGLDAMTLPGGFVTAAHPTAQIVYVGTLRYTRDDFLAITDVRVLDRYGQATAAARRLYGADVTIAKSLWRPFR
jgi:hypothetical protein